MGQVLNIDLDKIIQISQNAGTEILKVYENHEIAKNFIRKDDNSPVTQADIASHNLIASELETLTPDVPLLSEENTHKIQTPERQSWQNYWLVDPLDGTKEFLKRNGEFTVNIALMHRNKPVLGVIHIPCTGETYYAEQGCGSFKLANDSSQRIHAHNKEANATVLVSKSHIGKRTQRFVELYKEEMENQDLNLQPMGSSLKFCAIADGSASIYPRLAPTMEWDTAAGEIIVTEAGGLCHRYEGNKPLLYNKADLLNPFFIAHTSDVDFELFKKIYSRLNT